MAWNSEHCKVKLRSPLFPLLCGTDWSSPTYPLCVRYNLSPKDSTVKPPFKSQKMQKAGAKCSENRVTNYKVFFPYSTAKLK